MMKSNTLLTLSLIVFFITAGYVFVKYFALASETRIIKVEANGINEWQKPQFWLSNKFQPGNTERNSFGKVIAEVIESQVYERGDESYDIYVIVKITGQTNARDGRFYYKGIPVVNGLPISIKLSSLNLIGTIIDNNYHQPDQEKFNLNVVWRSVKPWQVNLVTKGSAMLELPSKRAIATINSSRSELPVASNLSSLTNGRMSIINDPQSRDLYINLDLIAEKTEGYFVFAGHQKIKVGESIWVYTPTLDMESMEIISVQPLSKK